MSSTRSVPFLCREELVPQSKPSEENWHVSFWTHWEATVQSTTNNRKNFHISHPMKGEEHCSKQIINIPCLYPFPTNISLPTHLLSTKFTYDVSYGQRFWSCFYCCYTASTVLISVHFSWVIQALARADSGSLLGWDFLLFFFSYFLNLMSQLILNRWLFSFQE